MAEQTFKSPNFFEREIDLSQRQQAPIGTPAGIIGTALKGPAFVPVIVGSFADFKTKFGGLDPASFGPYAVQKFLQHRSAVTYLRVLGAGANDTTTDISNTRLKGTVKNAGFVIASQTSGDAVGRHNGAVQFIAAKHFLSASEGLGFPVFTDNSSYAFNSVYTSGDSVNLIRAMVLLPSGTRMMVMDGAGDTFSSNMDDVATLASSGASLGKFKLIISSSAPLYARTDGLTGLRILTASLNPTSNDYIAKVLNTNPDRFIQDEHLLYADFSVEDELATVSYASGAIAVLSGSSNTSLSSGDTTVAFRDMFGRFDTRFTTPRTPFIISQPFGTKEFNLFRVEALSDGEFANTQYKVSIANVRKSTDPSKKFGSFSVLIRAFDDSDLNPKVLEQYPVCTLDPTDQHYIARIIGDAKAAYMFDADSEDERRVVVSGKYPNVSALVRIIMDPSLEDGKVPPEALPFGFRGPGLLKVTDAVPGTGLLPRRLGAYGTGDLALTGSLLPPIPYRFKVTQGEVASTVAQNLQFAGNPGVNEFTDSRFYWGVKFERMPPTGSVSNAALNANIGSVGNPLLPAFSKFLGVRQLDALYTGSAADSVNDNKFTLARVALSNTTVSQVTGTAAQHMREAAYIRNGKPNPNTYTVDDAFLTGRLTLASLVNLTSSAEFNKFSDFTKFSTFLHGGFDGVNVLDPNAARLNDRASSSDTGGNATSAYLPPGLATNVEGTGQLNNAVFSYRTAARIMTDEFTVNTNILAIPGIRDSYVTDFAGQRTKDYGLAIYVMDIPEYDESINRLFDDSTTKPDVVQTANQFDTRAVDNNYCATYFPNVIIDDDENNLKVNVPSSIAAVAAYAFNDRTGFPWFAPAGFNRAALDFVTHTDVRLGSPDRDRLYDSRINPIANFPKAGTTPSFVIFGQKTLQFAKSALDRVNVRRMLLEVKRQVLDVTKTFVFEQNTKTTRDNWKKLITPRLALVQLQAGIESFKVVMDETNNTQSDIENNKLNGQITLVPTRTVEFIAVDFIITNAGVSFVE